MGFEYDSGNYDVLMDGFEKYVDFLGFEVCVVESVKNGKLCGLGINVYIEVCGIVLFNFVGVFGLCVGLYDVVIVCVNVIGNILVMVGVYSYG